MDPCCDESLPTFPLPSPEELDRLLEELKAAQEHVPEREEPPESVQARKARINEIRSKIDDCFDKLESEIMLNREDVDHQKEQELMRGNEDYAWFFSEEHISDHLKVPVAASDSQDVHRSSSKEVSEENIIEDNNSREKNKDGDPTSEHCTNTYQTDLDDKPTSSKSHKRRKKTKDHVGPDEKKLKANGRQQNCQTNVDVSAESVKPFASFPEAYQAMDENADLSNCDDLSVSVLLENSVQPESSETGSVHQMEEIEAAVVPNSDPSVVDMNLIETDPQQKWSHPGLLGFFNKIEANQSMEKENSTGDVSVDAENLCEGTPQPELPGIDYIDRMEERGAKPPKKKKKKKYSKMNALKQAPKVLVPTGFFDGMEEREANQPEEEVVNFAVEAQLSSPPPGPSGTGNRNRLEEWWEAVEPLQRKQKQFEQEGTDREDRNCHQHQNSVYRKKKKTLLTLAINSDSLNSQIENSREVNASYANHSAPHDQYDYYQDPQNNQGYLYAQQQQEQQGHVAQQEMYNAQLQQHQYQQQQYDSDRTQPVDSNNTQFYGYDSYGQYYKASSSRNRQIPKPYQQNWGLNDWNNANMGNPVYGHPALQNLQYIQGHQQGQQQYVPSAVFAPQAYQANPGPCQHAQQQSQHFITVSVPVQQYAQSTMASSALLQPNNQHNLLPARLTPLNNAANQNQMVVAQQNADNQIQNSNQETTQRRVLKKKPVGQQTSLPSVMDKTVEKLINDHLEILRLISEQIWKQAINDETSLTPTQIETLKEIKFQMFPYKEKEFTQEQLALVLLATKPDFTLVKTKPSSSTQ